MHVRACRPTERSWAWSRSITAPIGSAPSTSSPARCVCCSTSQQDESPSFAPNGAALIYGTKQGGRGALAIVSADGRYQQQLSSDSGDVREPAWSPFMTPP